MASKRVFYRVVGTKELRNGNGQVVGTRTAYQDCCDLEAARLWIARKSRAFHGYKFSAILRVTETIETAERLD